MVPRHVGNQPNLGPSQTIFLDNNKKRSNVKLPLLFFGHVRKIAENFYAAEGYMFVDSSLSLLCKLSVDLLAENFDAFSVEGLSPA